MAASTNSASAGRSASAAATTPGITVVSSLSATLVSASRAAIAV
jgi:hypothetical protein